MPGTLYIVATPLGNLQDFSPRAIETLRTADLIAAEDTRVTLKLLYKFEIKNTLISYNKNNARQRGEELLALLLEGKSVALVSDAGTPAISDPGEELVALALAHHITIAPIPGCSAVTTALSVCGLPTGRFCFEGFLPVQKSGRRERLISLQDETRTLIFYEAPHKLQKTLEDLLKAFGNRRISILRELTKLHEEIILTTIEAAIARYEETQPRGEFVLVLEGAAEKEPELQDIEIDQSLSAKDNAKAAKDAGLSRNEAYKLALQKKKEERQGE